LRAIFRLVDIVGLAGTPECADYRTASRAPFEARGCRSQSVSPVARVVLPVQPYILIFKFSVKGIEEGEPFIKELKQVFLASVSNVMGFMPSLQQASTFCSQLTYLKYVHNQYKSTIGIISTKTLPNKNSSPQAEDQKP